MIACDLMATDAVCNLCGRKDFRIIENDEAPFMVLKCRSCGLVFVDPLPDLSYLAAHYDENYYSEWTGQQQTKRISLWKRRLKKIERRIPTGRLLDVGCATGAFLELAQQNGWDINGTEYSPYAASFAQDLLKTDIFCGHLTDAGYREETFDVITFWHVLEHVTDPTAYLREAHRILKPSGLLIAAVPNVDDHVMKIAYRIVKGRPLKLFRKSDREVHLFHFSADTIGRYMHKTGFHCLNISPDYGIVDPSKKLINAVAAALYHVTGMRVFSAIEVYAKRT